MFSPFKNCICLFFTPTTTTGNVAKALLNTNNHFLLTNGIDDIKLWSSIDEIILNMAVILTIINSNDTVKLDEYTEICRATYLS